MGVGPISSYNSHQSSISYISWKAKHHSILHPHSPKSSYICLQVLQAEVFHQSHLSLRNQSFHPCPHILMMMKKNYFWWARQCLFLQHSPHFLKGQIPQHLPSSQFQFSLHLSPNAARAPPEPLEPEEPEFPVLSTHFFFLRFFLNDVQIARVHTFISDDQGNGCLMNNCLMTKMLVASTHSQSWSTIYHILWTWDWFSWRLYCQWWRLTFLQKCL